MLRNPVTDEQVNNVIKSFNFVNQEALEQRNKKEKAEKKQLKLEKKQKKLNKEVKRLEKEAKKLNKQIIENSNEQNSAVSNVSADVVSIVSNDSNISIVPLDEANVIEQIHDLLQQAGYLEVTDVEIVEKK